MLLINPFFRGLIGCRWPGLLSGELVHNLALVHPTALVGVQLGLSYPLIYPERGGPEPFPVAPGAPSSEQEKNPGGLPRPVYVGSQCL